MTTRCFSVTATAILAVACGAPSSGVEEPRQQVSEEARFEEVAEAYYEAYLEFHPTRAVRLGYHEYDGRLPDLSDETLEGRAARLAAFVELFEAIDEQSLPPIERVEHAVLLMNARRELFGLETLRVPWRNPMHYMRYLDLIPYMARDYKPREERIRSVTEIARAAQGLLIQADENLEDEIPKPWLETAIKQVKGTIPFVRDDVVAALGEPEDPDLRKDFLASLETLAVHLEGYQQKLEKRLPHATDDWALGEEDFLWLLREGQGVDMDIETLEAMGRADLERNLAALEQAARQIDPDLGVEEAVEKVVEDKPPLGGVLDEAEAQAAEMRKFLIDQDIITIPTDDIAQVRESPPYKRWNAASLDSVGPFEEKPLSSYYYITPPDPTWPEAEQRAYVPGKTDLLFITIHELWPGHFLHSLHVKKNPSRILKTFWSYTMGEGWAHYTEEMMWEQGAAGDDPRAHVGQLLNALLRNVRFISAIGLHAKDMSVEESTQMFRQKAFCDPGNARQQAVRGTFDPMYLSYTLGKLMILDLREDWKEKKGEAFTLKEFHDTLLSYGCAPVPAIREAMLGAD